MIDASSIKNDFPIFDSQPDLVYLDSTATSLKPKSVIEKINEYYRSYSANVHRGIYALSEKATAEYEAAREAIAEFIHANRSEEIIFTRNTTESLNLIAYSLGRDIIRENDEIVTTQMEHHSNFVPWQTLALENGGVFKIIEVSPEGYLTTAGDKNIDLHKVISRKTKILALTYVSNVLGTINPIREIISNAKKINPDIITVVDAAQATPHMLINVEEIGCDFLAFSSHKMLGPTGIGVLWGKYDLLDRMFPFQFGGEMIMEVSLEKTTFKKPPYKFEAGTPHIAGAIGLHAAINYLKKIGMNEIHLHEQKLIEYAQKTLIQAFGSKIRILGPNNIKDKTGIVSFSLGDIHPHDIAQILDEDQIAVRAGHQCAMPLHTSLKIGASARASFYLYNTKADVDKLISGLQKVEKVFIK